MLSHLPTETGGVLRVKAHRFLRILAAAGCLLLGCPMLSGCGPKATMLRDPSIVATPTPAAMAQATSTPVQQGSGVVYRNAIETVSGVRYLAISLLDYPTAFNQYADQYGFPYPLPRDLGIGDKRTVQHEFAEGLVLTFSLDGGWITRIELTCEEATPDAFAELSAGGIATLLAADPMLIESDIAMLLEELGLGEDAEDLEGEIVYDELALSWEITDEDGMVFVARPAQEPTTTP